MIKKSLILLPATLFTAVVLLQISAPVQASANQKRLGATLFHERGCEHCHGTDLRGGDLGPDISTIGKQWKKPQIEHQIVHGGGGMPAFADALQPDEITALVDFLHSKRKAPKPAKLATPPPSASPAKAP